VPAAAPEAPSTPAPERPGADEAERTEPAPVAAEPVDGVAPRPQAIPEEQTPERVAEQPAPAPADRAAARVGEAPVPAHDHGAPARDDGRAPQGLVDVPPAAPASIDAAAVRRVWSEILAAAKQRSRSTGALLVNATVRAIEGDVIVLAIGSEPLARRLSEQRNTDVIADALHAVLGVRWRVRCDHGDAPPAASARPAVSRAPAPPQRPSRPAPTRPAPTRRSAPEEAEPLPPEPPDEDAPPDDEEAMMAEAAADSASPAVRRDPEEVAIELLSAQLGATAMDRR
jgi:DNA polymerase III subunit gamma/tau